MNSDSFSPTDSLGLLVKRAQQAFRVALDAALASVGLSTAQYATLVAVAGDPGLSNVDLARRVFVTPQTMHGVVAGIEREAWIVRAPGGPWRSASPRRERPCSRRAMRLRPRSSAG